MEAAPSPDGQTRCTLRDAITGRPLRQWTGQILDALPDLSLMVTAADYRTDRPLGHGLAPATGQVVEVATGRVIGRFPMTDPWMSGLWAARLSRDGHYLCLAGNAQPGRLLRLPDMSPVLSLPPLASLRVVQNDSRVVGVTRDGTLHFWSLPSGRHTAVATDLTRARWAYALDDGTLAIEGERGTNPNAHNVVQVRSADGTRLLRSLPVMAEAYSADGRIIGSSARDEHGKSTYDVSDLATGRRVARLNTATDPLGQSPAQNRPAGASLAIAPDGRRFAYATNDGLLRLYALDVSEPPTSPASDNGGRRLLSFVGTGNDPGLFDAVALPGGGVAACGGAEMPSNQRQIQVWRPGQGILAIKAVVRNGDMSRLGVSRDGALLAGSSQGGVWVLDLARGQSAVTPIAVANDTRDISTRQAGRPVWLDGPGRPFTVVPTGMFWNKPLLMTRWDAGHEIGVKTTLPAEEMVGGQAYELGAAETSPNGRLLAVLWNGAGKRTGGGGRESGETTDGMMELRDTRTGYLIRTLLSTHGGGSHPSYLGALGAPAFSSDGRLLAVADEQGRVLVYDTATGHKIGQMSGTRTVQTSEEAMFVGDLFVGAARLAFAPDGRFLAAARDDGSLCLYSLRTFLPVARIGQLNVPGVGIPGQQASALRWMAFNARGHTLYGIAQNGSDVLAWDVPSMP